MEYVDGAVAVLEGIGEALPSVDNVLFDALDEQLGAVSAAVGFPMDQLKYVACLVMVYPLSLVFRALPKSLVVRQVFATVFGFGMGLYVFREAMVHSLFTATMVYLLVLFTPSSLRPKVVFVFTLGYMCLCHIYRQYTDYGGWSLDVTGPQMILTIKLTSFAYNVSDGDRLDKCDKEQKKYAVTRMPSLLEFYSFVYYFGGFLAGPAFEFSDYRAFMERSVSKDGCPSAWVPSLTKFVLALVFMGGVMIGDMFDVKFMSTDAYWALPLFHRLGYQWLSVTMYRYKYYFGWFLAEGGCNAAGFGHDEESGSWDKITNVRVLEVEFAPNVRSVMANWNIGTAVWLRRYVYNRLNPDTSKGAPLYVQLATYMTSAFWHGFYPGYYMTFFSGALMNNAARGLRKAFRPRAVAGGAVVKKLYDIASFLTTAIILNYTCTPFTLLFFADGWRMWKSVFFLGHILTVAAMFLAPMLVPRKPKSKSS